MENQIYELIGITAVATMVCSYALEYRHPAYIGVFAAACWVAAFYAYLIEAFPFVIAEGLWGLIALRRWRRAVAAEGAIISR